MRSIILDIRDRLEIGRQFDSWSIVQGRFLRRGDIVDSLRMGWKVPEPREINSVGDCGDECRRTFFEKPNGSRVRIRLFFGRVEQDLIDFRF